MNQIIDLTGRIFGFWTILKREGFVLSSQGRRYTTWLCRCDKGHQQVLTRADLYRNNPRSCNKCNDLTGLIFSKLTVIGRVGVNKHNGSLWECLCECGKHVIASKNHLKNKHVQSCGCRRLDYIDLSGRVYGRLTVIERYNEKGDGEVQYLCRCNCGTEKIIKANNLMKGNTKSCGCLRRELRGKYSKQWRGGKGKTSCGYVKIYMPNHPNARKQYVLEHIYVMSEHIGRPIIKGETVHHKNGIRHDNRIENLELWSSNHPSGQRVIDLVHYAKEILSRYEPSALVINNL